MRFARRVDANQKEIVEALRLAGARVKVTHQPFDLQVWTPSGKSAYFEVKNGATAHGKRGMKGLEGKQLEESIGLTLFVVDTPEVAVALYEEFCK